MNRDRIFLITVSILVLLTIILSSFSLNRFGGILLNKFVVFEFKFRIFIEHFLTGFYVPLIITFFTYLGIIGLLFLSESNLSWISNNSKRVVLTGLCIGSIINIGFEIWWQFFRSYNSDSLSQTIYLVLGVVACWVYSVKIKLFD